MQCVAVKVDKNYAPDEFILYIRCILNPFVILISVPVSRLALILGRGSFVPLHQFLSVISSLEPIFLLNSFGVYPHNERPQRAASQHSHNRPRRPRKNDSG